MTDDSGLYGFGGGPGFAPGVPAPIMPQLPEPFTQADHVRLQQLQAGLSQLQQQQDQGVLEPFEADLLRQNILRVRAPLMARQQQASQAAQKEQASQLMHQNALAESIAQQHALASAQSFARTVASYTDPLTGKTAHFFQKKRGEWEPIEFPGGEEEGVPEGEVSDFQGFTAHGYRGQGPPPELVGPEQPYQPQGPPEPTTEDLWMRSAPPAPGEEASLEYLQSLFGRPGEAPEQRGVDVGGKTIAAAREEAQLRMARERPAGRPDQPGMEPAGYREWKRAGGEVAGPRPDLTPRQKEAVLRMARATAALEKARSSGEPMPYDEYLNARTQLVVSGHADSPDIPPGRPPSEELDLDTGSAAPAGEAGPKEDATGAFALSEHETSVLRARAARLVQPVQMPPGGVRDRQGAAFVHRQIAARQNAINNLVAHWSQGILRQKQQDAMLTGRYAQAQQMQHTRELERIRREGEMKQRALTYEKSLEERDKRRQELRQDTAAARKEKQESQEATEKRRLAEFHKHFADVKREKISEKWHPDAQWDEAWKRVDQAEESLAHRRPKRGPQPEGEQAPPTSWDEVKDRYQQAPAPGQAATAAGPQAAVPAVRTPQVAQQEFEKHSDRTALKPPPPPAGSPTSWEDVKERYSSQAAAPQAATPAAPQPAGGPVSSIKPARVRELLAAARAEQGSREAAGDEGFHAARFVLEQAFRSGRALTVDEARKYQQYVRLIRNPRVRNSMTLSR